MRRLLFGGPGFGFPKNRSGPGLGLYTVLVRSDPGLGRSLGAETADRRRIGVRDRNLHAEPTGVKRDDFVDSLSVGMRPHVSLSIESVFVRSRKVHLRIDKVFQDAAELGSLSSTRANGFALMFP